MLKAKEKVLDDIARVVGGTASVFGGITQNVREEIKSYIDEMAEQLDLVPREDLTALEMRIEAIEQQLNAKPNTEKTGT